MSGRGYAHVSLELGHFYLRDLTPERIESLASQEAEWTAPILAGLRERNCTVSSVIMVDDYFVPEGQEEEVREKEALVIDCYREAGLPLDYLVRESECAVTARSFVDRYFMRAPEGNAVGPVGTAERGPRLDHPWLHSEDPGEGSTSRPIPSALGGGVTAVADPPSAAGRPTGPHSIHVEVELWSGEGSGRKWSCPLLAAWWQLIRLGVAFSPDAEGRDQPVDERVGRPLRQDAPPLPAHRTLSVLSAPFLLVEAAVQTILEHVVIADPSWARHLRTSAEEADVQAHRERVGYLFPPTALAGGS